MKQRFLGKAVGSNLPINKEEYFTNEKKAIVTTD